MDLSDLKWRRETGTALASNSHLAHLVGCNGFFTALVRSARMRGDAELAEWWSARRCAAAWGEAVRSDGYGVWVEGGWRRPFLFEFDLASERLAQLEAKLGGYALPFRVAGYPTWVLFSFPTRGRETAARRVLVHPAVPVATAVLPAAQSPDGAVWMAVGGSGPRRRLADLGHPAGVLEQLQMRPE